MTKLYLDIETIECEWKTYNMSRKWIDISYVIKYDNPIHPIKIKEGYFLSSRIKYSGGVYIIDFSRLDDGLKDWIKQEIPKTKIIDNGLIGSEVWFLTKEDFVAFKLRAL